MSTRNSRTALITGASSGIGAAFARKLASQGHDLVLVARRETKLTQLAAELQQQFQVDPEVLVTDLSQLANVERVERYLAGLPTLAVLVNNAGFGDLGMFAEAPLEHIQAIIDVHVLASTRLSRAALPVLIARGKGSIINVSSIGAFLPGSPIEVLYCATKAYLNVFSEGLQAQLELQGVGIRVQALCPGFVPTEFHDNPAYEAYQIKTRIPKWLWMPAEEVVEVSLRYLEYGQVICIPGLKNRLIVMLLHNGLVKFLTKKMNHYLQDIRSIDLREGKIAR